MSAKDSSATFGAPPKVATREPEYDLFISFCSSDRRRELFGKSIDVVAELKKALERYPHPKTGRRFRVCTFDEDFKLKKETIEEAILDHIHNDPSQSKNLQRLRRDLLAPLQERSKPNPSAFEWVEIPAGGKVQRFRMMAQLPSIGAVTK